jgi:hypothetical protein
MFKKIMGYFFLTPVQQKTLKLIELALQKKTYSIEKNYFKRYDDLNYDTHCLRVKINLNSETIIVFDNTVFVNEELLIYDPLARRSVWFPEISSRKAYNLVQSHFENILLEKIKNNSDLDNKRRNKLTEGIALSHKKDSVRETMNKNFGS